MTKKTPDEYDKYMLELAVHARNVMKQRGAYLAPEEKNESNHGYITVGEICDLLDIALTQWRDVKKKMISMGEALTIDDFGGHYLGRPGSQAKTPAMLITRAMTMLETASFYIMSLQGLKEWKECQTMLGELLGNSRHDIGMKSIPQLLNGAGLKVDADFERKLLAKGE